MHRLLINNQKQWFRGDIISLGSKKSNLYIHIYTLNMQILPTSLIKTLRNFYMCKRQIVKSLFGKKGLWVTFNSTNTLESKLIQRNILTTISTFTEQQGINLVLLKYFTKNSSSQRWNYFSERYQHGPWVKRNREWVLAKQTSTQLTLKFLSCCAYVVNLQLYWSLKISQSNWVKFPLWKRDFPLIRAK